MFPLKRLTEQAELDAENQQGERPAVRSDQNGPSRRPRRILRGASVEPADRDLVWRGTDSVVLGVAAKC
jgi:hypothetical protein